MRQIAKRSAQHRAIEIDAQLRREAHKLEPLTSDRMQFRSDYVEEPDDAIDSRKQLSRPRAGLSHPTPCDRALAYWLDSFNTLVLQARHRAINRREMSAQLERGLGGFACSCFKGLFSSLRFESFGLIYEFPAPRLKLPELPISISAVLFKFIFFSPSDLVSAVGATEAPIVRKVPPSQSDGDVVLAHRDNRITVVHRRCESPGFVLRVRPEAENPEGALFNQPKRSTSASMR